MKTMSPVALLLAVMLQPIKPACQLLSVAEVAGVVGVPVAIDPSQSGPGDNKNWDFCAWKLPNGYFVILGVGTIPTEAGARSEYTSMSVSAFGGGPSAAPVSGLADEAQYRDYAGGHLKGGVVVMRKGAVVYTVEAPTSQKDVIALARLVLSRAAAR